MLWMLTSVALAVDISPGEDWCTAVNSASPGEEVVLLSGEHLGPCAISAVGVTLRGVSAAIRYDGNGSNVVDVLVDDVTLADLSFLPTNANIDAVKIKAGDRTTVSGCTFDQIGGISISANSADSSGIVIENNAFFDLQATGIYLGCHDGDCAARDYRVSDNLIDGVTSNGVGYGMEFKLNSYGLVRDNVIVDTQGPAIEVFGTEDGTMTEVRGNLVSGSRNNGTLELGGGPVLVASNIVVGGADAGIYVYDYGGRGLARDIEVTGNTVIGSDGPAILLGSNVLSSVIVNNAVWQQAGAGPALPSGNGDVQVVDNADCDETCWLDAADWNFFPDQMPVSQAVEVDFCGQARAATPSAGALEVSASGARFTVDFKDQFDCGSEPGTTPTGTPTGTPGTSTSSTSTGLTVEGNADETTGCGCTVTSSTSQWWLWGPILLMTLRRRSPQP